jgi:hypothetical protein
MAKVEVKHTAKDSVFTDLFPFRSICLSSIRRFIQKIRRPRLRILNPLHAGVFLQSIRTMILDFASGID